MRILTLTNHVRAADPQLAPYFLDRLETLALRQAATTDPEDRIAQGAATFSTFLDCLDLGLEVEARRILDRARDKTARPR